MSLTLESHAKINLFLRILGKRPDGFHSVQTLMLPISLSDTLTFESTSKPQIKIESSDPHLPTDRSNLIYRAAELIQSRYAPKKGVRICLEKRIPIGAGLGGGSSNGSNTLVGLNKLWNLNLPFETLESLAAEFGSDTAFFVQNRPALSEGRGEVLTPTPFNVSLPILLINFGFGSATAWAYRHFKPLAQDSKNNGDTISHIVSKSEKATCHVDLLARNSNSLLKNDLELPVFQKFPILKIAKDFLSSHPKVAGAMMCGSGSTMMAVLHSKEDETQLRKDITQKFGSSLWTWSGKTLTSSPLAAVHGSSAISSLS
jgi:4-diphosphocytidyl-2-C-methyl-D-erythritol kinase